MLLPDIRAKVAKASLTGTLRAEKLTRAAAFTPMKVAVIKRIIKQK
jgi:hypothetical protein